MKILGLVAIAALVLTACGQASGATTGPTTVKATLKEMTITVDKTAVPAGTVTFHVTNVGTVTHELVLLKTDLPYDQLPPDPDEAGKVLEDEGQTIVHIGETEDMEPGTTKDFTVDVTAGKYVLLCNEVGHYAGGMRLAFNVQ